jgi:hypothetical protein
MQYLYHVLSLREPVFIRPAELGGIQHVFFIKVKAEVEECRSERSEESLRSFALLRMTP